MLLGDRIAQALEIVGIDQQRVERWLGAPCNCPERQAKLNQIDSWARRILHGKIRMAVNYLEQILKD